MAKHKDGKPKLPKRIGGVKLPKELRKTGDRLLAEAAKPETRAMLAGVVAMGAEALKRGAAEAAKAAPAKPGGGASQDRVSPLIGLAASALGGWLDRAAGKTDAPPPKPH